MPCVRSACASVPARGLIAQTLRGRGQLMQVLGVGSLDHGNHHALGQTDHQADIDVVVHARSGRPDNVALSSGVSRSAIAAARITRSVTVGRADPSDWAASFRCNGTASVISMRAVT